jgi:GGDEF domain-containing protein
MAANSLYTEILNHSSLFYKVIRNNDVYLSPALAERLLLPKNIASDKFSQQLSQATYQAYQQAITEVSKTLKTSQEVVYEIGDLTFKESLYSIKSNDENYIISIVTELSDQLLAMKTLKDDVYLDIETNLPNHAKLQRMMDDYLKGKYTFFLVELNDDLRLFQTHEKYLNHLKEVSSLLSAKLEGSVCYRLTTSQLMIIYPHNDLRKIANQVKMLQELINNYNSVILNQNLQLMIVYLRYPVLSQTLKPQLIFTYLQATLDKLRMSNSTLMIGEFQYQYYEEFRFESNVIDYINHAINSDSFALVLKQITNLNKNTIWQYESALMIDKFNLDTDYIVEIAKRRGHIVKLEKYHLHAVLVFLHQVLKETDRLVKVTIPLSDVTLLSSGFVSYCLTYFKHFQIPFEFVRFKLNFRSFKLSSSYLVLDELAKLGIGLDITNLEGCLQYNFNALYYRLPNKPNNQHYDYLASLNQFLSNHQKALIIDNVSDRKIADQLIKREIHYASGKLYKIRAAHQVLQMVKDAVTTNTKIETKNKEEEEL